MPQPIATLTHRLRSLLASKLCCGLAALTAAVMLARAGEGDFPGLALPVVGEHGLRILAPTVLELTRFNSKPAGGAPVDGWDLVDAAGVFHAPAVAALLVMVDGVPATIAEIGFKRRPAYAPLLVRDLRIGNCLYLRLAAAITEEQLVVVTNPGGQLWTAHETYAATSTPLRYSPAIHVNQEGYVPSLPKKAMVGHYLGSLGELSVSAAGGFSLVTAPGGVVVYQGSLTPRPDVGYVYLPTPYQKVLEADFSSVTMPGRYQLVVPGLGTSLPFAIDEGVAMDFLRTYALGLYQQRCGTDNVMPFTRFVHGACHLAAAEVPSPQADHAFTWSTISGKNGDVATNPRHTAPQLAGEAAQLYPFVNKGFVDVSGGHHDAGDYSKYTTNSAELAHLLMFTVDAILGAGALDNLGIPESGDGIGDLLQEAKQETDYLAKLQDADGGFYFIVYPNQREYESNVLPENGDTQVVWPKNTAATAAAVAALAQAGSSPRFKAAYPAVAALYLKKAKLGWQFLMNAFAAHGRDGAYQKITFYGDNYLHDDELAWAACELFVATGEAQYRQKLFEWFPDPGDPLTFRWGWWRMSECWGNAIRSYAFAVRTGRLTADQLDAPYLAKCEAQIVAAGDDALRWSNQNAYATSFPEETKRVQSAGWYFSLDQASDMAVAYQISPKAAYLDALVGNMNYEGGTNPVNVAYVTGLGQKRQREIVSQYALNDRRVLPPDGIPLGNIQTTFDYLSLYGTELRELVFPTDGTDPGGGAPYAFYDRWADTFNVTTEYIGVNQARSLLSLAVLATRTTTQTQAWTAGSAQIVTPVLTAALGEPTTLSLQTPGFDLSAARIVWEARDQEPAFGATYTISPKNNGAQWVEAEIAMPDGRRLFALATFNANSAVVNWMNGAAPLGAASFASGGDAWTWVVPSPATPSGQLAHRSNLAVGEHSHWFQNATATVDVGVGDILFAWIYLDPVNPPTEVLLSWDDGSPEHRSYWGTNTITWGVNNSAGRRYVGPLPPAGQWVRLSVPASAVGLEGRTVTGMGFSLVDGRATWDTAGVVAVAATPPVITTQPLSRTAVIGSDTTFVVAVSGTTPFVYQWMQDGTPLAGATSATLTLTDLTTVHAGSYTVTVTNSAGSTISEPALLTLSAASGAPAISVQPQSRAGAVGSPVSFTVLASGNAVLAYQWRKGGTAVPLATSAALTFAGVQTSDAGSYDCVITNGAGSATSIAALLTVTPAFTLQPQSQPVGAGASVTFTVAAAGVAPLAYQWFRSGRAIVGATAVSLTISGAEPLRDNGWYQAVVSSSAGAATSAAAFVNVAAGPAEIVAWGRNVEGEATVPGGLSTAVAVASGGAHSLALKADGSVAAWGRNVEGQATVPGGLNQVAGFAAGLAHSVALRTDGTVVAWGANHYGQSTVPVGLAGVVSVAAGNFHTLALRGDGTVVAWGDNGSGQTKIPMGLTNVVGIAAGAAHSLALKGDGTVVAWGYNGSGQAKVPVGLANVVRVAAGYYHSAALKADGTIAVWGWNGYGQTTVPAGLAASAGVGAGDSQTSVLQADGTVFAWGDGSLGETAVPLGLGGIIGLSMGGNHTLALRDARVLPVFGLQPVNVSVVAGQAAVFFVTATGVPAPSFQWRKNGAIIVGATGSSYSLSATVVADAGNYDVFATNSLGSVTSAVAVLAVAKVTPILSWAAPASIAYGVALSASQLNATASVPGTLAYTPAAGAILNAGANQALGVSFTPTDTANIASVTGATTLTVTTNFAWWRVGSFSSAELADPARSGPDAVYALDGISNRIKYALGLEPAQNSEAALPQLAVVGPEYVYSYTRPTSRPDVTYAVQVSTDLDEWGIAGLVHERDPIAGATESWRARYTIGANTKVFFRLVLGVGEQSVHLLPTAGLRFTLNGGSLVAPVTTAFAIPLTDTPRTGGATVARISAMTATTLTVVGANWTPGALASAAFPYAVRLQSGAAAGAIFPIAANTADTLTFSGVNLATVGVIGGVTGDTIRLLPVDTLNTLFGATTFLGGASAPEADAVMLNSGSTQVGYYYSTAMSRWVRSSGPTTDRGHVPIPLTGSISVTRRAGAIVLTAIGRVPDVRFGMIVPNSGTTYTHTGFPTDVTLHGFSLPLILPGWISASTAASADTLSVSAGAGWVAYFHNGTYWQRTTGPAANRNAVVIPAGTPVFFSKRGTANGSQYLYRGLPYSW